MAIYRIEWHRLYAKILARAWSDAAFKSLLLREPRKALAEFGVSLDEKITVQVLENTETTVYLPLLPPPWPSEIKVDDVPVMTPMYPVCACENCDRTNDNDCTRTDRCGGT